MSDQRFETLRTYFENDSRKFVHVRVGSGKRNHLGSGAFGVAYVLRESNKDGTEKRKFVVKYARSNERGPKELETEIRIIKKLYGACHIAQPIIDSGDMRKFDNLPENVAIENQTALFTEFLRHGTLRQFRNNYESEYPGEPIPNRILWMVFLCLVRVVIALTKPPDKDYGQDTEDPALEEFTGSEPNPDQYQILHGDLYNLDNVVFGEFDNVEHHLVPILKAIDFGCATECSFKESIMDPVLLNMSQISKLVQLIYRVQVNPNLDMELHDLAERCCAVNRPTLSELLILVQNAVTSKTGPEHFPGKPFAHRESDEKITEIIQKIMEPMSEVF